MNIPQAPVEMVKSTADVGEGRTMEQIRASFLDAQPVAGGDVSIRLARIEAKLNATAQAFDRLLAHTEALVEHSPDAASSLRPSGPMLTKKEVARRFQISTRTVDRWRSMGIDLGEITVRGTIRFDPEKIGKIIATQKIKRRRNT